MTRSGYIAAFLALGSVAYALPSPVALPGAVPLPSYAIAGAVAHPAPMNAVQAVFRGVTADEALTSGVYEGAAFYLENANESTGVFPWGVYSEVRTVHASGGAVALYGRMRNEGTGWATAIHAEPVASGMGTTIGVNVEPSPMPGSGRVIGVNIQAVDGYESTHPHLPTHQAINLQSAPETRFIDGIRYECRADTGIHFAGGSQTTRAIWIEGTHQVGIDTSAPIRLQAGTPLQLEGTAQVAMVFANGRIEFRNGSRVLAWLAIDSSATGGRMN